MPRASTRRLVAGRGRYVDDIPAKGEVYAAFLRSPHAHAAFEVVNISAAAAIPGVVRVLTAEDIDPVCPPWKCVLRNAPDLQSPEQRPLARRQAVFQGEPIALVVAQSRAIAEDALELIEVEWSERPAAISLEAAAMPDAVPAHENLKSNICWRFEHRSGDPDKAFADAEHVVQRRLVFARKTGVPLEPRGILASYDPSTNALTVHVSHQMPHQFQLHLAELLGMSPLQAISCGTKEAAFAVDPQGIGSLENGRWADVLVVDGDPVADISLLQDKSRLRALYKGGVAVDLTPQAEATRWPWEKSLEISHGELRYDAVHGKKAAE